VTTLEELRERHGHAVGQLGRFLVVGGSGVVVNLVVLVLAKKLLPHPDAVFLDLPLTSLNVRWYHVMSTIAFLVANLWNFQLNRTWTFQSGRHARWLAEYVPFLLIGLVGQALGLLLLTLLMHPASPLALPHDVFDDSSGLRTRIYWAQLIVILVVTPLSFAFNKGWTFRAVRGRARMARR
jgi:putative flippase GtrA